MLEWVVRKLIAWCERKGRTFCITGTGGPEDVYLIRYYVIKSKWLNVFLHRFLRSDRDDLHDHPWNFVTYLVKGAYTEKKWNPKTKKTDIIRRINFPEFNAAVNRLVFRKATDQHQVLTDRSLKLSEREEAPLTICVTGRTQREWGFVKNVPLDAIETIATKLEADVFGWQGELPTTKREWVPWRKYLGLPPETPGRG